MPTPIDERDAAVIKLRAQIAELQRVNLEATQMIAKLSDQVAQLEIQTEHMSLIIEEKDRLIHGPLHGRSRDM